MISKRNRRTRGAAMDEATLILLVFLTFLLTIIDFGLITYQHQTILHNVRRAARAAIVAQWVCAGDPCTDATVSTRVANIVKYGDPSGGTTPMFGMDTAAITTTKYGTYFDNETVVVSVTGYQYTVFTPGVSGKFSGKPITVSLPMEVYDP